MIGTSAMKELKFKKLEYTLDRNLNFRKNQSKLILLYSPLKTSKNLWKDRREAIRFSPLRLRLDTKVRY